ncbi:CPBP family intramembrane glutamic endopeptidase [Bacillus toyonensis]|uniref:CPBP family intramembrane glutamic endopeptidase n=1 Tax=Bacillus toyonensis TaxID=155322 RepID=UPI00211D956F|nr:CPBP family intramembrane glutamic endopeptidase [Bacillus toyonensis]
MFLLIELLTLEVERCHYVTFDFVLFRSFVYGKISLSVIPNTCISSFQYRHDSILIASVIEEGIFRKILPFGIEKLFESINRTTAVFIANGIFAAVHFDWFFFPYFINGCLYAWSYEKTRDIKVPIVAHIPFSSFVFLATSLY